MKFEENILKILDQKSSDILKKLIKIYSFGILVFGADGRLLSGNRYSYQFFGKLDADYEFNILNNSILDRMGCREQVQAAFLGREINIPSLKLNPSHLDNNLKDMDLVLNITMSPVFDENNNLEKVLLILNDISSGCPGRGFGRFGRQKLNFKVEPSEIKRMETPYVRESSKEIEDFVYTVSHDLKSPLLTIEGMINIIIMKHQKELGEELCEKLKRIQHNSGYMKMMLDDLLEFSRIKRMDNDVVHIDIMLVARQAATVCMEKHLKKRKIRTSFEGESVKVYYPLRRMSQVFTNLIDNAIKHACENPDPGISIRITSDSGNSDVLVAITDNGAGIEEHLKDQVFLPFRRLGPARDVSGTGMGLCLTKKIIESYGGKIWLESTPGNGVTAFFTIPAILREKSPDQLPLDV